MELRRPENSEIDAMPERELTLRFQIDTNRINARGRLEHMNRLERWAGLGLIEILISEPAFDEVLADHDPGRRRKGISYIQSLTQAFAPDELHLLDRIERMLFPRGAITASERHDVEIIFNAQKYGARLITADGASKRQPGGILGAADKLRRLGIVVLTDEEACRLVERHFAQRDELVRQWAKHAGQPLQPWVGKDG